MSPVSSSTADCNGAGEIMLFGVRVVVDSMRKCVSMNDLSQYEQSHLLNNNYNDNGNREDVVTVAAGYASADDAVPISNGSRERKRGVPWTEDEHRQFLVGLEKVGKGNWREIAKNIVKTRTPTQVASHAQKYFLRRSNNNRRRRRSSLFDIIAETVSPTPMEEEETGSRLDNSHQSYPLLPLPIQEPSNVSAFSLQPLPIENPINNSMLGRCNKLEAGETSAITDLNLSLGSMVDPSLKLSLPSEQIKKSSSSSSSRYSAFQVFSSFSNGDNTISVS